MDTTNNVEERTATEMALECSLGELAATVSITDDSQGHPEYMLTVTDARTLQSYSVENRFKKFRELKKDLDTCHKDLISSPFPQTFAKSKLGVKLNTGELTARCDALNTWMAEVISKRAELNKEEMKMLGDFFGLEELQIRGRKASDAATVLKKAIQKRAEAKAAAAAAAAEAAAKKKGMFSSASAGDVKVTVGDNGTPVPAAGGCCVIA